MNRQYLISDTQLRIIRSNMAILEQHLVNTPDSRASVQTIEKILDTIGAGGT